MITRVNLSKLDNHVILNIRLEHPAKKKRKKSQSSRPNNLMSKDEIKKK
jgi:hypothetical protein